MDNNKMIAFIPARSGSKGLKDKNVKLLGKMPLMAYSIKAAVESNLFDEIYVSTDSERYAKIAVDYGANVPFLREKHLAKDNTDSWTVVKEDLKRYMKIGRTFQTVVLLQPTSPLRIAQDIICSYNFFKEKKAKAVVSVCKAEHSPLWCFTLPENKSMYEYGKQEMITLSRQQLPTYYQENGSIYIVDTNFLLHTKKIYTKDCYAYVMSKQRSIDIDNEFDFQIAEFILHNL